jgi:hypothetical protein
MEIPRAEAIQEPSQPVPNGMTNYRRIEVVLLQLNKCLFMWHQCSR